MASEVPDPLQRLLSCRPASREVEDFLLDIGSIPPRAAIEAFWAEGQAVARHFLASRAPSGGSLEPLQPLPEKGPSKSVARALQVLATLKSDEHNSKLSLRQQLGEVEFKKRKGQQRLQRKKLAKERAWERACAARAVHEARPRSQAPSSAMAISAPTAAPSPFGGVLSADLAPIGAGRTACASLEHAAGEKRSALWPPGSPAPFVRARQATERSPSSYVASPSPVPPASRPPVLPVSRPLRLPSLSPVIERLLRCYFHRLASVSFLLIGQDCVCV